MADTARPGKPSRPLTERQEQAAVLEVLRDTSVTGNRITLPSISDQAVYRKTCEVLRHAGGTGHTGVYEFPGRAAGAVLAALLTGEHVLTERDIGFFPTPAAVVSTLLGELGGDLTGIVMLEPSAGKGAIAIAAAERGATVDCIELVPDYARAIEESGRVRNVICGDFLAIDPRPAYGAVILTPPFSQGIEVDHVMRAVQWVGEGGRVVAVLPSAITWRRDPLARQLRLLATATGVIRPLPPGSFSGAGDSADTVYLSFTRPGLPRRPNAPPRPTAGAWVQAGIF